MTLKHILVVIVVLQVAAAIFTISGTGLAGYVRSLTSDLSDSSALSVSHTLERLQSVSTSSLVVLVFAAVLALIVTIAMLILGYQHVVSVATEVGDDAAPRVATPSAATPSANPLASSATCDVKLFPDACLLVSLHFVATSRSGEEAEELPLVMEFLPFVESVLAEHAAAAPVFVGSHRCSFFISEQTSASKCLDTAVRIRQRVVDFNAVNTLEGFALRAIFDVGSPCFLSPSSSSRGLVPFVPGEFDRLDALLHLPASTSLSLLTQRFVTFTDCDRRATSSHLVLRVSHRLRGLHRAFSSSPTVDAEKNVNQRQGFVNVYEWFALSSDGADVDAIQRSVLSVLAACAARNLELAARELQTLHALMMKSDGEREFAAVQRSFEYLRTTGNLGLLSFQHLRWKVVISGEEDGDFSNSGGDDNDDADVAPPPPHQEQQLPPPSTQWSSRLLGSVAGIDDDGENAAPTTLTDENGSVSWTLAGAKTAPLGRGANSVVRLGLGVESGELVAIKELTIPAPRATADDDDDDVWSRTLGHEVDLLSQLSKHRNVVGYRSVCLDRKNRKAFIITEYVSGGSLQSVVDSFGALSEKTATRFLKDILSGLAHLHQHDCVHGDIKLSNVLVDVDGTCKVADFGTSQCLLSETSSATSSFSGSPLFCAPEQARGTLRKASDIWSVGLAALFLLCGANFQPYGGAAMSMLPMAFVFKLGSEEDCRPQIPSNLSMSSKTRAFVEACLQRDADKRPTAVDLLSKFGLFA